MGEQIRIISMNCRGLGDKVKRKDVLNYMTQKQYSIMCLQDIHIDPSEEQRVINEWGSDAVICGYKSNARGVGIFFNNNFEYSIKKVKKSESKGYIILELEIGDKSFLMVTLYGPNDDRPQFYQELLRDIVEFDLSSMILCGDWNLVMDQEKDTERYLHTNNPNAKRAVESMIADLSLCDVWRTQHEEERKYTYRQYNPRKQSRLDFFLASEDLLGVITGTNIMGGYRTDHSLVTLDFQIAKYKRGRGYWKFNSALLRDREYVDIVKDTLWETVEMYAALPYNRQNLKNIPLDKIRLSISDQLFLETLLMNVRGNSISFSSKKKRKAAQQEKDLEKKICEIEESIHADFARIDAHKLETLNNYKDELQSIRDVKIKGCMLRAKVSWLDAGERPSKYFLNLENRNYTNKLIPKIILDSGEEILKQEDILKEQKNYYENLYSEKLNTSREAINEQLSKLPGPKLSDDVARGLEGHITMKELSQALKYMKNDKSPGLDGFSSEFFKFFWCDLKEFVLRSLNEALDTGLLSISLRRGLISCIPKPGKTRLRLKNWRPISLLSVVYKMASTCIANRLKPVLDDLIHEDQKGFIKGRFIGENIRQTYDILFEARKQNIPGLLMLIDFEKAFDSISWNFIKESLLFFNFGPTLIKWVEVFYNQVQSCVIQNGHISSLFDLRRGCRQGDPLSPYLFLLCGEILAIMIRNNKKRYTDLAKDSQD